MSAITLPGSIAAYVPVPSGRIFAQPRSANASFEVAVNTDTSDALGDKSKAANQSVAAAAGAALNDLSSLASDVKALGDNPYHLQVATFTIDPSTGQTISSASLDDRGDLEVHSRGSSNGASTQICIFLTGTQGASWGSQASANLAQAAYSLNSILDKLSSSASSATVDASA